MRTITRFSLVQRASLMAALLVLLFAGIALAQGTAFTYQGRLTDKGNPANGDYDLQFKLFDTPTVGGGTQQGATLTRNPVTASAGVFTVQLDFGANVFDGTARYLEIGVRPAGNPDAYTVLAPRQPITSSPYAIQTLNATNAQQLGGVAASQYVQTTDSRLSDSRPPTAGSSNYIQNTIVQQATAANFNISGNGFIGGYVGIGTASPLSRLHIVSGSSDILPPRLQSSGTSSFAAGWDFYHGVTGKGYVGVPESAAGIAPGEMLLLGGAGTKTSLWAGGARAVTVATNGNVGIGTTTPGARLIVQGPDTSASTVAFEVDNSTGAYGLAVVDDGTVLVRGNVGIGTTTTPGARLLVQGPDTSASTVAFEVDNSTGAYGLAVVDDGTVLMRGNVGIGTTTTPDRTLTVNGRAKVAIIPGAGGTESGSVCFNPQGDILNCGLSSLRYKSNVELFLGGLDIVQRLRPISFTWKDSGKSDIGLGAEEMAQVAPSFTYTNGKGEVEGVKYDRLNIVLINAIKDQQAQIETLLAQNAALTACVRTVEMALGKRRQHKRPQYKRPAS